MADESNGKEEEAIHQIEFTIAVKVTEEPNERTKTSATYYLAKALNNAFGLDRVSIVSNGARFVYDEAGPGMCAWVPLDSPEPAVSGD